MTFLAVTQAHTRCAHISKIDTLYSLQRTVSLASPLAGISHPLLQDLKLGILHTHTHTRTHTHTHTHTHDIEAILKEQLTEITTGDDLHLQEDLARRNCIVQIRVSSPRLFVLRTQHNLQRHHHTPLYIIVVVIII